MTGTPSNPRLLCANTLSPKLFPPPFALYFEQNLFEGGQNLTTSIREGTSDEETTFPSLTHSVDADVVIIGRGITGMMAAMLLTKGGKRVVVLEAKRVGSGSTGRSTGNLHVLPDQSLNLVRKKWGKETAELVAESREEAIRLLEFTVASYTVCYTVRSRRRSSPTRRWRERNSV